MNFSSRIDSIFSVVVKEGDDICHLGAINALSFSLFVNDFMYWKRSMVGGDNFSREHNLFLESENPDMKIFKLFTILESQGG